MKLLSLGWWRGERKEGRRKRGGKRRKEREEVRGGKGNRKWDMEENQIIVSKIEKKKRG